MLEVTELLNGGWLVEGQDVKGNSGRTVLDSGPWRTYLTMTAHKEAVAEFDATVEEFFAPLTEAANIAAEAVTAPGDDWAMVEIEEAVEGVAGVAIELDSDGVLLRLLAETDHSTLRWVDDSTLVAVA